MLILVVSDQSTNEGKAFDISHAGLGGGKIEIRVVDDSITMTYGQRQFRLTTRGGALCYLFDGKQFRQVFREGIGYVEDNAAQSDAVWGQCQEWINTELLTKLDLSGDRTGWQTFFEALPWESCQVHIQPLKTLYDINTIN